MKRHLLTDDLANKLIDPFGVIQCEGFRLSNHAKVKLENELISELDRLEDGMELPQKKTYSAQIRKLAEQLYLCEFELMLGGRVFQVTEIDVEIDELWDRVLYSLNTLTKGQSRRNLSASNKGHSLMNVLHTTKN